MKQPTGTVWRNAASTSAEPCQAGRPAAPEARPFLAPVGKPRSVRIRIPAAGSSPDGVTTRARACPAAGRKFPVGHLEEGAVGACLRDAGIAEEVAR